MRSAATLAVPAGTFRVLGDPTRVAVARALSREELRVCDPATLLGVSRSAGVVLAQGAPPAPAGPLPRGGWIAHYALDDERIAHLLREGMRHVEEAP